METLMKYLQDASYEFNEYQKPGSYQRLGDQIKIYFPSSEALTVSFWGDEIETIMQNKAEVSSITIHSL
jgi:excinuclease UvrABC helicase subunit UvrB